MKDELKKNYRTEYDIFGLPQEYRGIKLYPILLKDLEYQDLFYKVFAHPKNYIPNVEVLKSSYLKFLLYVISPISKQNMIDDFLKVLKYITKKDDIKVLYRLINDKNDLSSIELKVSIDGIEIDEYEFEDIREIVLEQNNLSIEYVESYNPELEVHLEFINKDSSDITLQDQIFTLCAIMKIPLSEISNYTLFQFGNIMEKVLVLREFDLYKPLLVSGQISLKNGGEVKHYLYHSMKKGRYDSILVDKDKFMEKNKDAFN
jgi:hypothetical protein